MLRVHGHQLTDDSEDKPVEFGVKMGGVSNGKDDNKSVSQQKGGSAAATKPDRGRGRGRGQQRGRGNYPFRLDQRNYVPCELCGKHGHLMHECNQFKHGPEVRQKLKNLNRCDACLIHKNDHVECPKLMKQCPKCYSNLHYSITCDGKHPGSWIKNTS